MKIAFPVPEDHGLESSVFGHFGSAPCFVFVDSATNAVSSINNENQHHEHGACQPLKALSNQVPDVVIVGGIGRGANLKLRATKIKVFRAIAGTIQDNLNAFNAGKLAEISPDEGCAGHETGDHGHGHGQNHGAGPGCAHGKIVVKKLPAAGH